MRSRRCDPGLADIAALSTPVTGLHVFALPDGPAAPGQPIAVRARMFAADIGGEDPATGSASLGFAGWLIASGLAAGDGETTYTISQGVEMGRPSVLACDVTASGGRIERVRVVRSRGPRGVGTHSASLKPRRCGQPPFRLRPALGCLHREDASVLPRWKGGGHQLSDRGRRGGGGRRRQWPGQPSSAAAGTRTDAGHRGRPR